ncbi:MAG TPA: pitrilysin family protein [Chloroflexota bacterium]|nr:pitrilysin family protein [Chloroflexota bacterium]
MAETLLTALPNGLRLALHPMPATYSVSVVVLVGTGGRYESDEQAGISHLLEHMMFKGTERRPSAQQIAETVERLGGRFNASTSRELTTYYVKVPSHHLEVGLDLLADMLQHSLLAEAEIEREKGVILEEIAQGEDVPTVVGAHLLQRTVWGNHPLGRPVIGSRETVQALGRADLHAYLAGHYAPSRMVVSVAGHVDADAAASRLSELYAGWPATPAPLALPAEYPEQAAPVALSHHDGQAHLLLSAPGVALDHPDQMAFALMSEILGGGMSSRLFLEVRERRGLAYSVGASSSSLSDYGALTVHAGVAPARAVDALHVIGAELRRLAEQEVSDDELERVRGHYEGTLLLALEDSYNMASRNGRSVLQRGYARTPEESISLVQAVTAADIRRLAADLLQPRDLRLAVVGPFDDPVPFASALGEPG